MASPYPLASPSQPPQQKPQLQLTNGEGRHSLLPLTRPHPPRRTSFGPIASATGSKLNHGLTWLQPLQLPPSTPTPPQPTCNTEISKTSTRLMPSWTSAEVQPPSSSQKANPSSQNRTHRPTFPPRAANTNMSIKVNKTNCRPPCCLQPPPLPLTNTWSTP